MKHQYSRAELYALGEPLGNDATRCKPGIGVIYGKGGSSKSSQSSSTTTTNTDKRLVVDGGSIGISSDSSTVNVQSLDGGIVSKALDTVAAADATAGEGFDKLLGLTEKLFDAGGKLLETNSATTLAQLDTLNTARNDSQGKVDQKTIILLAAAGIGVAWVLKK